MSWSPALWFVGSGLRVLVGGGGTVCATVGDGVGDGEGDGVSGVGVGVDVAVGIGVGLTTLTTGRGQAEAPTAPRIRPITKAATTAPMEFRLEITGQA
jgi:hypothetical protein